MVRVPLDYVADEEATLLRLLGEHMDVVEPAAE